jgi:hypothetical protein
MTTDGAIYNSGSTAGTVNDPTLWNALSVVLTYQYPDGGIGIYRYKHHLIAFGTDSIEFFNDIGNPPPASRLERTEQAFIKFGATHSLGILNVDDTMYWLAYSSTNTVGLWKLEGYTPVKVSTSKQDALVANTIVGSTTLTDISLFSILFANKKHLGINYITSNSLVITSTNGNFGNALDTFYSDQGTSTARGGILMYSLEDKVWWAFKYMQKFDASIFPSVIYPGRGTDASKMFKQYILISEQGSGTATSISPSQVFTLGSLEAGGYVDRSPDGFATDSLPIECIVQFNALEFDNLNKKRVSKATLVFPSVPKVAGIDSNTYSISLFYNKLNYSDGTGTLERTINYPNAVGRYYWNNIGISRYWVFTVLAMNKDPFSVKALDLTVSQGTH